MKFLMSLFILLFSNCLLAKDYCYVLSGMKRYGANGNAEGLFRDDWNFYNRLRYQKRCKIFHNLNSLVTEIDTVHPYLESNQSTDEIYIFVEAHGGKCGYVALDEPSEGVNMGTNHINLVSLLKRLSLNYKTAYISSSCYGGDLLLRALDDKEINFGNLCMVMGAAPGHTGGIWTFEYTARRPLAQSLFSQWYHGRRQTPVNVYSSAYVFEELDYFDSVAGIGNFFKKVYQTDELKIVDRLVAKIFYKHGASAQTNNVARLRRLRTKYLFQPNYQSFSGFTKAFDSLYLKGLQGRVQNPEKCRGVMIDALSYLYNGMTVGQMYTSMIDNLKRHPQASACHGGDGRFALDVLVPEGGNLYYAKLLSIPMHNLYQLEPELYLATNLEEVLASITIPEAPARNWSDLIDHYPYRVGVQSYHKKFESIDWALQNLLYEYSRLDSIARAPEDLTRYRACQNMVPEF